MTEHPEIALMGCPNSGKSALFNRLTGSHQKIGNYPGVTVEKATGTLRLPSGKEISLIDLPGVYSFFPHSLEEQISLNFLEKNPNIPVVAITDAAHLDRTLGLVLELKELGQLSIVALNMIDLAEKKGLVIDIEKLAQRLGVPVIPICSITKDGAYPLLHFLDQHWEEMLGQRKNLLKPKKPNIPDLMVRSQKVHSLIDACVRQVSNQKNWSFLIDRVVLHPIFGGPILAFFMFLMFQAVFSWAQYPMDWLEEGFLLLGGQLETLLPEGLITSFVVHGLLSGVSAVFIFLPQIILLFSFIFLLEASGYMMRAAFIMDRLMSLIGLQGLCFIPLLSSFACAIPGIMSTRTIKNDTHRRITMMIVPLMTCSARWPIYVLLVGAFIPAKTLGFFFNLQGLVLFGLFVLGVVSACLLAWFLSQFMPKKEEAISIFDMPSYKMPSLNSLFWFLNHRIKMFIANAGKTIVAVSAVLWVLCNFPKPPEGATEPPIRYSLAGQVGSALEPILRPIGFDWRIAASLIPGFAAREVMVSSLATVFALEQSSLEDSGGLGIQKLQEKMTQVWSLGTGLSLLVWYVFAPQCLSTFAVMRRESGSWLWTGLSFVSLLLMAYLGSFFTYHLFTFLS
jgi:ferrous iron transport protein B